jgi:DNA-binding transcriptional MerR regulator
MASHGGLMTTGDLSVRTGLSLRSIRYYEEVGLVLPIERSPGGHRLYGDAALQRVLLIMKMKPLDFTLDEMGAVLTALDEVRLEDASAATQAREKLAMFAALVEQRYEWLKERLQIAEEFRAQLRAEVEPTQPRAPRR